VLKKIFYLIATGMAMFQDLAVGAFIAAAVASLSGITIEWWHLAVGAFLAVLPDFDFVVPIFRRLAGGKPVEGNHHESVLHWPTFMLPVATALAWLAGGSFWAAAAFTCLLFHYIHDAYTLDPKDSLGWLFRLRPSYWSRLGIEDETNTEYGEWIEGWWLQPSKTSVLEIGIGSVAVGLIATVLASNAFVGLMFTSTFWVGAILVWITWLPYKKLQH